ncbi:MAG: oxidoreductase [Rhodobacterales bacterium 34-62-10]|nr:MAG: oxidoreductase [Rhodobacterales bacterium 34-62-10]
MSEKIALITGASRGLGTTGALEELDDRIKAAGGQATLAPMDITKPEAMAQLCRSIHDRWGRVDLWAHTAVHAAPLSPASTIDARDWDKSVACNVTATGQLIPYIAPLLGSAGSAIFFDDLRAGQKFFGAYGATKAAQIALAQSWAAETVKTGPDVHILTPAPMTTATRARFFPGEDRSTLAHPRDEAARLLTLLG